MADTGKDTNPKQAFADTKLPLDVVPAIVVAYAALGFLEGGLKYGKVNWRASGVRASTYIAAIKRHLEKFEEGEDADPTTLVPHLANLIASAGIIIDAQTAGTLHDDRPRSNPGAIAFIEGRGAEIANHLRELFAGKNPVHYLIGDRTEQRPSDSYCTSTSAMPKAGGG